MIAALWILALGGTAHAGEFERLGAHTAEASSWLTTEKGRYGGAHHPGYAVDDDRETAWVEGVEGDGVGETLTIPVSRLSSANRLQLKIRNGNQRSTSALEDNPAPHKVIVRALLSGQSQLYEVAVLERTKGWQTVTLNVADNRGFDAVSLEIVSVHPGSTGHTAISDIQVFVDSEVEHNPSLEAKRTESLTRDLARVATMGAYLGSTPSGTAPFAHEQFTVDNTEIPPAKAESALVESRQQLQRMQRKTDRHSVVINRPIPTPGGAWQMEHYVDLFTPETLTITPTDRDIAERKPPPDMEWIQEWVRSTARIQFAKEDDTRPVRMHFSLRTVIMERGTSESDAEYLVKYDTGGNPDWVFTSEDFAYDGHNGGHRDTLITFSKDSSGRITGWEAVMLSKAGGTSYAYREAAVPTAGT